MSLRYPDARRLDLVEELHGHSVADPYRWLEDATSDETVAWSKSQDELLGSYLDTLSGRDRLRTRFRELIPGFIGPPHVLGDRAFFSRRLPGQEHAQFLVREGDGTERVLIDPSELSPDDTITLDGVSPSKEGDRLAYLLSDSGTEDETLHVMDVGTGEDIDEPVSVGRAGSVAWLPGGEAFYYVRRLPEAERPEGEDQFHRRVWLRRISTPVTDDTLVFGADRDKTTYYGITTSRDGQWLVVSCSLGTAPRNDLYIAGVGDDPAQLEFAAIQEDVDAQTFGGVHRDGRLYLFTNRDAPRNRLVVTDPATPSTEHWTDLLPETDLVLDDHALTDGAVVAVRSRHAVSEITVHDKTTGAIRTTVSLPGLGSAGVNARPEGGNDVWIGYTDHVTPYQVLHYDVVTEAIEVWATAPGAVDTPGISAEQTFVTSADGTEVPMFLITRDDVKLDGDNPTILYGYGGFNVALTPGYQSSILGWVEAGGVFAVANLRGGSEEGEEWHRAGMREHKQNVFDDYFACAEWLIASGHTRPERLGIEGGSNGGLLVGAALTQRPELFRAVLCGAPLLDMVRYERFGLGVTWNDEYGTADDPTELGWLLGYSPYHRVVPGTAYPAVLFTVFESDTRVDPLHARKLCAALQAATTSDPDERPVLIRSERQVGHAGRSISRSIELLVDEVSFLADQVGLDLASAPT